MRCRAHHCVLIVLSSLGAIHWVIETTRYVASPQRYGDMDEAGGQEAWLLMTVFSLQMSGKEHHVIEKGRQFDPLLCLLHASFNPKKGLPFILNFHDHPSFLERKLSKKTPKPLIQYR